MSLRRRSSVLRAWLALVLTGGVGALLLTASLWPDRDDTVSRDAYVGFALLGLAMLATALYGAVVALYRPRTHVRYGVEDGEPALVVSLSNHVPRALALALATWVALGVGGVVLLDHPGSRVLVGLATVPVVVALVQVTGAALRSPRLVLRPDRIGLVGAYHDAAVGWHDLVGADVIALNPHYPAIRLFVRPGAESFRYAPRSVVRLGRSRRPQPVIDLPLTALGAPGRLVALVNRMVLLDPIGRGALIDADGVGFLDGTMSSGSSGSPGAGGETAR